MTKGYAGQLKGEQKHVTIAPLGSGKHGLDVLPKALFELDPVSQVPVSSELKSFFDEDSGMKTKKQLIEITGHGMKEGDVLRFDSGPLINIEASVIEVIDPNFLALGNEIADATTSTCLKMRPITLTIDSAGNLAVASTPVKIVLDGVDTEVTKDTTVAANTIPMPVELVSATGIEATFNVTTGDLNIAATHDGVAAIFDSFRLGDGTNLLIVNASGEALVHDTDLLAELLLQKAILSLGSTAAKQDLAQTRLNLLATEARQITLQNRADLLATNADLLLMSAKLPATLGSKADAASLAVTQSTEDKVIQAAIQAAVEATQASTADKDVVENYYKRNFATTPLTAVASWVTLRTLTSSIKKLIITQNGGNELLIRNATSGKEIIVGQGVGMEISLLGVATDVIEISSLGVDSVDGIIYINFEG